MVSGQSWRIVCSALVLAICGASCAKKPPPLDDFGPLPEFSLTDHKGRTVTHGDLTGRVSIVNFVFTRCPTVCPTVSMKMKKVQERTAKHGSALRIYSISVDPEYDTPERLNAFASKFSADPERWRFLTGDKSLIEDQLVKTAKLALETQGSFDDGTPNIVHGTHFLLIDQKRHIRGYYNSDTAERLDDLVRDSALLLD